MPYCKYCGQQLLGNENFCTSCGSSLKGITIDNNKKIQFVYAGEVRKCPNCGEVLGTFTDSCSACGYVLRGLKTTNSVQELSCKLSIIDDDKPPSGPFGIVTKKAYERSKADKVQRKAALIRNFIIPNTREDLWEFLILASTNIDNEPVTELSDAWNAKFNQAYIEAEIVFGNSSDFDKVKCLRDKR